MLETKLRKMLYVIAFVYLLILLAITPVAIWGYSYANRILDGFSNAKALSTIFERNSFLYEENGDLLCEIHGEINRTPIPLNQVPLLVQKAFVAIEDERFYKHRGVDLKALLRLAVNYCKRGRITEGASTITQQVMKLYFLSPEQTIQRKAREAVLALEFERRFSKSDILEFYLNRVYFGEGAYGIQSASKVYFNKDAGELTLAEGALLAALLQSPSVTDPYINPEAAKRRRDVVLEKMYEQEYIHSIQKIEAQLTPIELDNTAILENYDSYFIDYVMDEAITAVGNDKIFKGGLKIYTTLEPEIQSKAEQICARNELFPGEQVEAAVVMVENGTGAIKALVGGRQYVVNRGFNRATQLARQPGSAFKPIAVYAPAFEQGYVPESVIQDSPFRVGNYEPRNSGGGFYGSISIRTAVQWSRNVAAVRLLNQIGVDAGFEMAKKLGFELVEDDRCLPLALGGLTNGVSPLQMAAAYATFPNHGIYIKPYAIKRIEDAQGQVLYQRPVGTMVMKASTADFMTDVLRAAVNSGTGTRANIRGTQVAGKTGTTELPDTPEFRGLSGNKDAWFVGFTDKYTAAVWMGYDEKNMDRQHYLTSYGGNQPAELFRLVMANAMNLDSGPAGGYGLQPQLAAADQQDEDEADEQDEENGSEKTGAKGAAGVNSAIGTTGLPSKQEGQDKQNGQSGQNGLEGQGDSTKQVITPGMSEEKKSDKTGTPVKQQNTPENKNNPVENTASEKEIKTEPAQSTTQKLNEKPETANKSLVPNP